MNTLILLEHDLEEMTNGRVGQAGPNERGKARQ
jgi:hypothetical protein